MRNTVHILGIPVDKVTMPEAVERVESFLSKDSVHTIYTPNAEIMLDAQHDAYLKTILQQADMLVADGAGVVLAGKILGTRLPGRVTGVDLTKKMFSVDSDKKTKFFFFGGKPGIAEAAGENILKDYPNVEIVGYHDGYFSKEDEKNILDTINASGADILLVALGAPKQEKWIHEHKNDLKVKICIGVGGSLDIYAGQVKLAPDFFRKNGLEWLYRLYKEPWRYKRMMKLPQFVLYTLGVKLRKGQ